MNRQTHKLSLFFFVLLSAVAQAQVTGIYVEVWRPPTANPCSSGTPRANDGWFPVPGFPDRTAYCPGTSIAPGLPYGSNVTFSANSGASYRIFAVDSAQSIGAINVSGSGYTLLVGRSTSSGPPFTSQTAFLAVAGASSIQSISAPGATLQVRSTGSVGPISSAASIERVDARNSTSSINASGEIGTVRAPSITGTISGS
jgi:hypothetical protein